MKTTTLFGLIMLFSVLVYGQASLEFNQIKLVSSQETVPSGHVWKVTSVLGSSALTISSGSTTSASQVILVNGASIYVTSRVGRHQGTTSTSTSYTRTSDQSFGPITQMPVWLPEGTTLEAGTGTASISVIEFVVQ